MIQISKPIFPRATYREVKKVIRSGQLAQGKKVKEFEEGFSKLVGGVECVAVNSGTSALHLALISLNIKQGDEVIVPSFSFAASANVIALVGATPVFIDIDPEFYCLDETKLEGLITKKTKAVIVVHLYGQAANMSEIKKICKKNNILIIEDAAQAHLSEFNGEKIGTWGDVSCFSFYTTKNMTTGEGGIVASRNTEVTRNIRLLRNQGMEKKYANEIVGFNLRMTEISAAIGIQQLKFIKKWTKIRIRNADYYNQNLKKVVLPSVRKNSSHSFHQYTIRVPQELRQKLVDYLESHKISVGIYYPTPIHELPSFKSSNWILPVTEKLKAECVSLPVHPSLRKRHLKKVCSKINTFLSVNLS